MKKPNLSHVLNVENTLNISSGTKREILGAPKAPQTGGGKGGGGNGMLQQNL